MLVPIQQSFFTFVIGVHSLLKLVLTNITFYIPINSMVGMKWKSLFLKLLAMQILKSTIALLTFYLFSPTITIWTWLCYIFFLFNVFRRFCGLLILVKTLPKTKAICPTLHNHYLINNMRFWK